MGRCHEDHICCATCLIGVILALEATWLSFFLSNFLESLLARWANQLLVDLDESLLERFFVVLFREVLVCLEYFDEVSVAVFGDLTPSVAIEHREK